MARITNKTRRSILLGVSAITGFYVKASSGATSSSTSTSNKTTGLQGELAAENGASLVGFIQGAGGAGAAVRSVQEKLRDTSSIKDFGAKGDGRSDDTKAIDWAIKNRTLNTSNFSVPLGIFSINNQLSLSDYYNITGYGDASQIKVSAGSAFAYTSQSAVFDDHPHTFLEKVRLTGNGTFAAYPHVQSGTTIGENFAIADAIGNFASSYGVTYELHAIGKYVKKSFVHNGTYNYYRANKVGLQLDEVTSYTESNSYFRYNSDAAVKIKGGQNINICGGAIEGNPGSAIKYVQGSSNWGQLNLDNVYFESNGNEGEGVWSIDIPFGSPLMVNINGGSLWRNVAKGVASGPYRLGDNVALDGANINGSFYAKFARMRNTRGMPTWNTFSSETAARRFGLVEPVTILDYSPAVQEYNLSSASGGLVFCTQPQSRGTAKILGVNNLAHLNYPYGFEVSGGVTGTVNASLNYGDGDFYRVTFAARVGNFNNNYVTLQGFSDTSRPYRVSCVIFYPESDCEIAIVQSLGGQSIYANFALKAHTFYRMVMCGFVSMTAGSLLRTFPINANGATINFLPVWSSQHSTHKEQLLVMSKLVQGLI